MTLQLLTLAYIYTLVGKRDFLFKNRSLGAYLEQSRFENMSTLGHSFMLAPEQSSSDRQKCV